MRAKPIKPPALTSPKPSPASADVKRAAAKSPSTKPQLEMLPISPRQRTALDGRTPQRSLAAPVVRPRETSATLSPLLRRRNRIRRGIRRRLWIVITLLSLLLCVTTTLALLTSPRLYVQAVRN